MARAIQLAKRGIYTTHPNPRVGCVLVNNNAIIGEGWHERAGQPHAEINALADRDKRAGHDAAKYEIKGATAYVTLEPCSHTGRTPPCSQALIQAGVTRVIAAMQDPNPLVSGNGLRQLSETGIATASGLLEQQAYDLNPGFIKRMVYGLPRVSVKLAMSLDGRTAMESGESKWITSEDARKDVQLLRARSAAVLTGQGTVLADDPSLNVRMSADELGISGEVRQPVRVILDPELKTPVNAHMFSLSGQIWVITNSANSSKIARLSDAGAEVLPVTSGRQADRLSLRSVMKLLARREINDVHVEAGATLCGALLQENLVDELVIYMAPHLMGASARGLLNLPGLEKMSQRIELDIQDIRAVGRDWRITANVGSRDASTISH